MYLRTLMILPLALSLLGGDKDAPKPQDKDYEGAWELVSSIKNGEKLPQPRQGKKIVLTHDKGNYTVKIGDDLVAVGTYKVDPSRKPRTQDLMPAVGPNKGKTLLGIYEVKGDELHSCIADPDKERPKEFTSKVGSGHLLNTWKRIKP